MRLRLGDSVYTVAGFTLRLLLIASLAAVLWLGLAAVVMWGAR